MWIEAQYTLGCEIKGLNNCVISKQLVDRACGHLHEFAVKRNVGRKLENLRKEEVLAGSVSVGMLQNQGSKGQTPCGE
jgi:hypothetical protein